MEVYIGWQIRGSELVGRVTAEQRGSKLAERKYYAVIPYTRPFRGHRTKEKTLPRVEVSNTAPLQKLD
jgi:hypothetical protein